MDGEDLELFERTLRHATDRNTGAALDAALDESGWHEALATDRRAAISLLFELQGASNSTSSALGHVVTHALGLPGSPGTGVVLPAIGRAGPPGAVLDHDLRVHGLAPGGLAHQEWALVVSAAGDAVVALRVPTVSLSLRRVEGIDPGLALLEVTADGIGTDGQPGVACDWASALALGRLAIAHELIGASRTMLELAREHALARIQFGRPISSFQAIRHRLAETLVAVETADALADAAWLDGSPGTAAMAKAMAGRQARTAARHCQQVLAGIGFTTEHALHRFIRRTLVLDGLFGTAAALTRALGSEAIARAELPVMIPL